MGCRVSGVHGLMVQEKSGRSTLASVPKTAPDSKTVKTLNPKPPALKLSGPMSRDVPSKPAKILILGHPSYDAGTYRLRVEGLGFGVWALEFMNL